MTDATATATLQAENLAMKHFCKTCTKLATAAVGTATCGEEVSHHMHITDVAIVHISTTWESGQLVDTSGDHRKKTNAHVPSQFEQHLSRCLTKTKSTLIRPPEV